MYHYAIAELQQKLENIIGKNTTPEAITWLREKAVAIRSEGTSAAQLNLAFAAVPRKTGRAVVQLTADDASALAAIRSGFTINNWTIDRLCRVWLLLQVDATDKNIYINKIENLFPAAEMNELAGLYAALPVLAYGEHWQKQCAEGIRSNIGLVLEAIMCNNPYPSENLADSAWNQLVLKAFFTEKPVQKIIGLDKRANVELAQILSDYAHERWAAHRPVNPLLWRCIGPFINEQFYHDMERVFTYGNETEKEAAALAMASSQYAPAMELLQQSSALKTAVESGTINWSTVAAENEKVS